MRRFAVGMVVACLSSIALGASSAAADEASLFSGPGQRPGPSILYKRPKLAPQLTNAAAGVWKAPPILISGASAYRDGEFLYQDFLYDWAPRASGNPVTLGSPRSSRSPTGPTPIPRPRATRTMRPTSSSSGSSR